MKRKTGLKSTGTAVLAAALIALLGAAPAFAHESEFEYKHHKECKPAATQFWKFGVMADTQWKANVDGVNPGTSAVGIINQLNRQFISNNVEFVIQVGDLVDKETDSPNGNSTARTMGTRAAASQALYDAGIGFFPLRGNHEASQTAALEFQSLYSQTTGSGPRVFGARNFTSPFSALSGLSYAFDYRNARFVLLDQFTRTDGTSYLGSSNNNIIDQLPWISGVLAEKKARDHAFVFGHKGLITENHVDSLFGANPAENPGAQNAFIGSLSAAGVRYYFGGHDHMHNRAIIASPDRSASVQDITTASNSYKFYIPQKPLNDARYNNPSREMEISQELFTIGYYIVTVDGPRVNVDFFSSPNGCSCDCDLVTTPTLSQFTKRESFGYSLNGREFLVAQGQTYTGVADAFSGTKAAILSGVNTGTGADYAGRAFTQTVNTGWSEGTCETGSNILSLWGMANTLGSRQTAAYTLSMTYDRHSVKHVDLENGAFGLATKDKNGNWVNAADMNLGPNYGGARTFVYGPWSPEYTIGTYGVDTASHSVWAVVNYNGDFAAAMFPAAPTKDRQERR